MLSQQNFVAVTYRMKSNRLDFVRPVAVTKIGKIYTVAMCVSATNENLTNGRALFSSHNYARVYIDFLNGRGKHAPP